MKTFLTLLRREWLQHRFGWALLALVPLALALLLLGFGSIELDTAPEERHGEAFAAMVALVSIAGTTAVMFVIFWLTSTVLAIGIARRDHQDRSIEFWLSLPTGHTVSLAAPMLVHLLLVPAAALLLGSMSGLVVSLVVVSRLLGFEAWLALPWGSVLAGAAAGVARVIAGVPLAALWLAPLTLVLLLFGAWFKRWAIPLALLSVGLGSVLLDSYFQQPLLVPMLSRIGDSALHAFASPGTFQAGGIKTPADVLDAVGQLPAWAVEDLVHSWRRAWSWSFAAGLAVTGALFALLVDWRRRCV